MIIRNTVILLGIIFLVFAFVYRKFGKLSWIHEWNRKYIKKEDEKNVIKESSYGLFWIGFGCLLDGAVSSYIPESVVGIIMFIFVLSGIGLMIHTFRGYNRP